MLLVYTLLCNFTLISSLIIFNDIKVYFLGGKNFLHNLDEIEN